MYDTQSAAGTNLIHESAQELKMFVTLPDNVPFHLILLEHFSQHFLCPVLASL